MSIIARKMNVSNIRHDFLGMKTVDSQSVIATCQEENFSRRLLYKKILNLFAIVPDDEIWARQKNPPTKQKSTQLVHNVCLPPKKT